MSDKPDRRWVFDPSNQEHPDDLPPEEKKYWYPGDDLPRWTARDERDRKSMTDWVNWQLDKIVDDEFLEGQANRDRDPGARRRTATWIKALGPEIERADHGDIGPLRRRLPHLARFLQPPKRERGRRFPKLTKYDPVQRAAEDVERIRGLWQKHYGKKNRPSGQLSAEQIAADRNSVSVEEIMNWKKKKRAE